MPSKVWRFLARVWKFVLREGPCGATCCPRQRIVQTCPRNVIQPTSIKGTKVHCRKLRIAYPTINQWTMKLNYHVTGYLHRGYVMNCTDMLVSSREGTPCKHLFRSQDALARLFALSLFASSSIPIIPWVLKHKLVSRFSTPWIYQSDGWNVCQRCKKRWFHSKLVTQLLARVCPRIIQLTLDPN